MDKHRVNVFDQKDEGDKGGGGVQSCKLYNYQLAQLTWVWIIQQFVLKPTTQALFPFHHSFWLLRELFTLILFSFPKKKKKQLQKLQYLRSKRNKNTASTRSIVMTYALHPVPWQEAPSHSPVKRASAQQREWSREMCFAWFPWYCLTSRG